MRDKWFALEAEPVNEAPMTIQNESIQYSGPALTRHWPGPTDEMLQSPAFEAVWQCIKGWDIAVPGAYHGYTGAEGNHVRAILDALAGPAVVRPPWR